MSNPETIRVIFRRVGGELIAMFPDIPYRVSDYDRSTGMIQGFVHAGQHCGVGRRYGIRNPAEITDPAVVALRRELESAPYFYNLEVIDEAQP